MAKSLFGNQQVHVFGKGLALLHVLRNVVIYHEFPARKNFYLEISLLSNPVGGEELTFKVREGWAEWHSPLTPGRQEELCESKASQVHVASSRPARVTQ